MFTPIKNFITYIQKNANFGSNTTATEETTKMETENLKLQTDGTEGVSTNGEQTPSSGAEDSEQETTEKDSQTPETITTKCAQISSVSTALRTSPRKSATVPIEAKLTESALEDDDIEAQIESSIMLKKPVKDATTNGTEIVELKKSPERSIFISHDYNRNQTATPIDDELEDFRHDPTDIVTSSPLNHRVKTDENCSVDSAEEAKDISDDDNATQCSHINIEKEEEEVDCHSGDKDVEKTDESGSVIEISGSEKGNDSAEKIILVDSEMEDEVPELRHFDDEDEDEIEEDEVEESFMDMNSFSDREVIVITEDVNENSTILPIDMNNTSDDPLAIACEEREAFVTDKMAALQELNLLNSSANSQDEDTATTATDDDMLWLRTDSNQQQDGEPSCSKNTVKLENANENETAPEKDERNGEGSDSGLGSETSTLHTTNTSIVDTSQLNTTSFVTTPLQSPNSHSRKNSENSDKLVVSTRLQSPLKESPKPLRSNLKRRLEDDDDVVDSLRTITSSTSSTTTTSSLSVNHNAMSGSLHKKPKRSINFENVQVYYFPRQQGFSCVPSAGGCTLGMGARHVGFKTLSLAEHAAELRRAHRMQLQEINPRGSSSDDSEESEEDYLSEGSGSDLDGESNGFLQPVSPKQRRAILKAAGIRKIDPSEKAECRNIRNSREVCGCSCRDFCDPETCACSQSGIKCQVDRDMFPCGCSRDACGNTIGRVEFNPARVRTHFIHTLMRLEMENRQQQNPYSPAAVTSATGTSSSYYQSHLQPQSNYSSGYASPAYNASAEIHQQTAANTYYHQPATSNASSLYGGQPTSIEMPLSGSSASTSSVATATTYGMDSLDSGLFGGAGSGATPSYGELMPVTSYHHHNMNFGNVQSQVSAYNSYHNSVSFLTTNTTTLNNTPTSYSSCAVPSIPPYGTATTTEATGDYHSVNSLATLETTTAPSCTTKTAAVSSLDTDGPGTSFISLSTPLASSSRLSQINDLLQHNRNATTALVAVSQTIDSTANLSVACSTATTTHMNGVDGDSGSDGGSSVPTYNITSINTPPIEDSHKSCMAYAELTATQTPAPIVVDNDGGPEKLPAPPPTPPQPSPVLEQSSSTSLTSEMSVPSTTNIRTTTETIAPMIDVTESRNALNTELTAQPHPQLQPQPQPQPNDNDVEVTATPTSDPAAEVSPIEVAAGN